MARQTWKPGNMLYPVPAVMVSCQRPGEKPNIITVAWAGTVCSDPVMVSISVRPERYSYDIIRETGEFAINLVTKKLTRATDYCGVRSGRDVDKFREMHLTPVAVQGISAPGIGESPVILACRVKERKALGTHDLFLAEVVSVSVDECRVFIPASLVSDTFEKNLEKYVGQEVEFILTEFNPHKRRVIGNRKQLIAAQKKEAAEALFARIEVGQTVVGTVKNVTDFGAFIDLGGADGLLHISEMSWGRVDNPKKQFKVGDEVKCFIKEINGEKIALSLKFEDQNPWLHAAEKYAIGTQVTGRVARMTPFGAFIVLEPGIDALLHVSQISNEHVDQPSDVLKIGESITAMVVDFKDGDKKKISLSIKALLKNSEPEKEAAPEEAAEETVPTAEDAPETLEVPTEIAEAVEEAPAAEEAKEDAE